MRKRSIIAALLLLALPAASSGQALRGSYFFETSLQRHRLNAAFAPQNDFISVPVLNNIGIESFSNTGLRNFMFPKDGTTYSYLNKNVSVQEFSKLMKSDPFLRESFDLDILSAGFRIGKAGYLTAGVSLIQRASAQANKDMFLFLKRGMAESTNTYRLDGSMMNIGAYGQAYAGYSHDLSDIVEGLRVGAKLKFLLGVGALQLALEDGSQIVMNDDQLAIGMKGSGTIAGLVNYDKDAEDFALTDSYINGFGVAIDLGAEYRMKLDEMFIDGLDFSLAVNDLGGLNFKDYAQKLTLGGSARYEAKQNLGEEGSDPFEETREELDKLSEFTVTAASGLKFSPSPSVYAGVEAPFMNERMSVGLLYCYTKGFSHLMASYNLTPVRWFNFGLNCTFVGPATQFGSYLEFIPKGGLGLFFGAELGSLKVSPQLLPVNNASASIRLGLNIVFR